MRECAVELRLSKVMWPREPAARSGDIGPTSDRQRHSHSLWGFAAEQSEADRSEKRPKSLADRTSSVGSTRQQDRGTSMFALQVGDFRDVGSDRQQENNSSEHRRLRALLFTSYWTNRL